MDGNKKEGRLPCKQGSLDYADSAASYQLPRQGGLDFADCAVRTLPHQRGSPDTGRVSQKQQSQLYEQGCSNATDMVVHSPQTASDVVTETQPEHEYNGMNFDQLKELNCRLTVEVETGRHVIKMLTDTARREISDVNIREIFDIVMQQRDDLMQIVELQKTHSLMYKAMKDAVANGGCSRCAVRDARDAMSAKSQVEDRVLTNALQCEEDLAAVGSERTYEKKEHNRIVLLNDGQTILMDVLNGGDRYAGCYTSSDDVTLSEAPSNVARINRNPLVDNFDGGRNRRESVDEATLLPSRTSVTSHLEGGLIRLPEPNDRPYCPVCSRFDFNSVEQLNHHVNSHFVNEAVAD